MDNGAPNTVNQSNTGSLWKALLLGIAVATPFALGGYFLVRDISGAMGSVLFLLLPTATGIATALYVDGKKLIVASLLMGLLIATGFLIVTGEEGWVCLLMSTPLIVFGLAIGAVIGSVIRWRMKSNYQGLLKLLIVGILPLCLMGAKSAEETSRRTLRDNTIEARLVVDASPERTWEQLKSIDKVTSKKGLLMTIGLPVPTSCKMEGEGVGAKRTCYFEQGHIEERVTEWNPPKSMKFEITNFDVPGRPWLSFKDASYELFQENGKTVIVRRTTILSRLSPVFYWSRMEKIGVDTEHEFLFDELSRRLNGAR